ncbi:dihydropteroate synthase [Thiomicrorhabdus sp. ZW0627]|uniref:dihydropteroate synthase n=1 Tax=Thiomicrorhabdus sp. ZW0627 TaxID=3039774 RepID=UPI002437462F|nr:dihydropteroate synthase [Thiomicrorhabdus sp. ZW0627]MDG6774687.1 dihydropteroate synthase [Thiomicrorhabdus sp. ZW0627]
MNKLKHLLDSRRSDHRSLPLVMGILNVTPDSFSDGGRFSTEDAVKEQVEKMVKAGVDIVDIGGESTRPGASFVSVSEELDRVMPAIELVRNCSDAAISIDTYKTEVMVEAIGKRVDLINDVNALQAEGAVELVAGSGIPVCLMHKQGDPQTMQAAPVYENVVDEVLSFLQTRIDVCESAGIARENILLDPGFGFGKTLKHNTDLFRALECFTELPYGILVGVSRKTMIGTLMGDVPVGERMIGSVAAALVAARKGAAIVRVHDVEETVQALKVSQQLWD